MLEGLEHAQTVCLFACCQKHESMWALQVATILYLLMLMAQLCHALSSSLAKEIFLHPRGIRPDQVLKGYFGTHQEGTTQSDYHRMSE